MNNKMSDADRIRECAEWCRARFGIPFKEQTTNYAAGEEMDEGFYLDFTVCDFMPVCAGSNRWISQMWQMDSGDRDTPPDVFEVPLVTEPQTPENVVFETVKMLINEQMKYYFPSGSDADVPF